MELVTIKKEEFNKIAEQFSCKNFFQTSMMGNVIESRGKEVYYLGLENKGDIKAIAVLSENGSFLGKKSFQCLKGFLADYNNRDVVKEFSQKLLEFVRKKGGFKLTIDPYIIEVERDIDGNVVDGGKNNYQVIKNLKNIGFIKSKVDVQVRYNFCLDVEGKTEEEIFKNFKASTRNIINKALRDGVEVKNITYQELKSFKEITEYTCQKRGFSDKTLEYYQSMFKEFKDKVVFKMAILNIKKYRKSLENAKKDYEKKLEKINNSKKKDNYLFELNNINTKLKKLNLIGADKEYINLAVAMFMLYGDETIYLFSGSLDEYMEFGGQYLIQWDTIKYAINNGYKRHNFFGILNFQDKNDKDYGIYLFKRGFNGYIEELLGEYYITTGIIGKFYKLKEKIK